MPAWKVRKSSVGDKYIIAETMVGAIQKFNRLEEESFTHWIEVEAELDLSEEEFKEMMNDPVSLEFHGEATRAEWFCDDGDFV